MNASNEELMAVMTSRAESAQSELAALKAELEKLREWFKNSYNVERCEFSPTDWKTLRDKALAERDTLKAESITWRECAMASAYERDALKLGLEVAKSLVTTQLQQVQSWRANKRPAEEWSDAVCGLYREIIKALMNTPIQIHEDSQIGLTMEGVNVREVSNGLGGTCWVAIAQIGSIFGSEVHGECRGIGTTREQALERLKEDQQKLAESLWA